MTDKLFRVRFYCNLDDPRPVNWPVKYPYWVSGETDTQSIVISYCDNKEYIFKNWPEAENLDISEREKIEFTDRFPKPKWYRG